LDWDHYATEEKQTLIFAGSNSRLDKGLPGVFVIALLSTCKKFLTVLACIPLFRDSVLLPVSEQIMRNLEAIFTRLPNVVGDYLISDLLAAHARWMDNNQELQNLETGPRNCPHGCHLRILSGQRCLNEIQWQKCKAFGD
jgi:hypothetical protein